MSFRFQSCMLFHRLPSSEFFRRDSELTACHCEPGAEFGWRPQLATFASDHVHAKGAEGEKRRQRDFIKKHTGIKVREGGIHNTPDTYYQSPLPEMASWDVIQDIDLNFGEYSLQGRKLKKHGNRFLKNLSRSSHSVDPVISSWRRMKHRGYNRSVWLFCAICNP